MASIEFRPGDTLSIIWKSVQSTPFGKQEVESSFVFSYDELLSKLKAKGKISKSRRSGSQGALFSRIIALSVNALKKGKWSTGSDIDPEIVFDKFKERFKDLSTSEYTNITDNAKKSLIDLFQSKNVLTKTQKKDLKEILRKIGCAV